MRDLPYGRIVERLEAENGHLKARVAELEAALEEARRPSEVWQRLEQIAADTIALKDEIDKAGSPSVCTGEDVEQSQHDVAPSGATVSSPDDRRVMLGSRSATPVRATSGDGQPQESTPSAPGAAVLPRPIEESKWPCFFCGSMQAHFGARTGRGLSTVPACEEHKGQHPLGEFTRDERTNNDDHSDALVEQAQRSSEATITVADADDVLDALAASIADGEIDYDDIKGPVGAKRAALELLRQVRVGLAIDPSSNRLRNEPAPIGTVTCINCGKSSDDPTGSACPSGGGPQHDWQERDLEDEQRTNDAPLGKAAGPSLDSGEVKERQLSQHTNGTKLVVLHVESDDNWMVGRSVDGGYRMLGPSRSTPEDAADDILRAQRTDKARA